MSKKPGSDPHDHDYGESISLILRSSIFFDEEEETRILEQCQACGIKEYEMNLYSITHVEDAIQMDVCSHCYEKINPSNISTTHHL